MDIQSITERFDLVAKKYDNHRRIFIPCFDDFYGTSIKFLTSIRKNFNNILELGTGTGLLTKYLFEVNNEAHFTLTDISEQMLEVAKERFNGLPNFNFIICDYSKQLPGNNYDLVCSALSIHHLDENQKYDLFSSIYQILTPGGIFINLDIFNATSELINKKYEEYWYNYVIENMPADNPDNNWRARRELDKENTIAKTIDLLKKSKFETVECIYNFMKFGVVLAIKQ